MDKEAIIRKITSRKFLLSVAAFIAVFCTGVAGVLPPEWCAVGMALSAGIYAACEAYVDGKSASANQVINTTSVSAASNSQKIVENVLAPGEKAGE